MIAVALTPIGFWRQVSGLAYLGSLGLLVLVEVAGEVGMGAQRWLDVGPIRIQPSEVAKVTLVMALAAYYDWLPARRVSNPLWLVPAPHPDLSPCRAWCSRSPTSARPCSSWARARGPVVRRASTGPTSRGLRSIGGAVFAVLDEPGTPWQLLHDYQYRRIDTFLDPTTDPLGQAYNITQAKIAWARAASG
jgi:rod shape determining protein RodA